MLHLISNSRIFSRQQAGDEIVLVQKMDDDWYVGRLGDKQGMFPVKFVEIIEDLPQETELQSQVNVYSLLLLKYIIRNSFRGSLIP